jgi:hypothetical protein
LRPFTRALATVRPLSRLAIRLRPFARLWACPRTVAAIGLLTRLRPFTGLWAFTGALSAIRALTRLPIRLRPFARPIIKIRARAPFIRSGTALLLARSSRSRLGRTAPLDLRQRQPGIRLLASFSADLNLPSLLLQIANLPRPRHEPLALRLVHVAEVNVAILCTPELVE